MIDFVRESIDKIAEMSTIELSDYYNYLYNLDDTKFSDEGVDILCYLLVYVGGILGERPVPDEYKELVNSEGDIEVDGDQIHWVTYRLFNINPTNIS